MKNLKEIFHQNRTKLNMSKEEFSLFLGLSITYISRMDAGKFVPGPRVLEIFSEKCNVDLDYLRTLRMKALVDNTEYGFNHDGGELNPIELNIFIISFTEQSSGISSTIDFAL